MSEEKTTSLRMLLNNFNSSGNSTEKELYKVLK